MKNESFVAVIAIAVIGFFIVNSLLSKINPEADNVINEKNIISYNSNTENQDANTVIQNTVDISVIEEINSESN